MRSGRRVAAGALLAVAAAVTARRCLRVVTVRGPSMEPTYAEGSRVLAVFLPPGALTVAVKRRAVAVCEFADWLPGAEPVAAGLFVKRVAALPGDTMRAPALAGVMDEWRPSARQARVPDGHCVVLGDNPSAADSRRFGFMPLTALRGIVIGTLPASTGQSARPTPGLAAAAATQDAS